MKRFLTLIFASLFALGFVACQDDPKELTPTITLGQTEVTIPSSGESVSIAYLVENPVEGEKIAVEGAPEWLTVNTSRVRTIELTATENTSSEERTATLTVTYKGAKNCTIDVKQACYDSPLRIEILEVTAADLYFSVYANDPELTWIPMVTSQAYFDSVQSDSEIFDMNIEYFEYLAEGRGLTLSEYLEQTVARGTIENILFEGLDPNSEYVLYLYGITTDGKRTTDIIWESIKTEEPWDGPLTFEFNVMEENHHLFFDVTPSHTGVPYYFTIVEKEDLEGWMEKYNTSNVREALQKGDIDETYQLLIDYEFIHDKSDYYALFNVMGRLFDEQMACDASTTYVLCAAKWNEDCQLLGEVSTFEYTSEPVEPSDNQISLRVENITQSSADVVTTTTNNDPYAVIPLQSSIVASMDDQALFDYLISNYDYLLSEYTFSGNRTRTYTHLEPNTRYTFVAFGYLAGTQTTSYITREEFTTSRSDDPKDCTFEFDWTVDTEEAWIQVTPSDDGHHYFCHIFDSRFTAEEVKDYIQNTIIGDWYEGSFSAFASWHLAQGKTSETVSGLLPDTEYKIAVVIMDYKSGEFLTDVIFSENFRTKAIEYANIRINLHFGSYYDIQQLVDSGKSGYKYYAQYGDAILPAQIDVIGDYDSFYYTVYARDLTDTVTYPDAIFVEHLPEDGSYYRATLFPISYDDADPDGTEKMYTMCAIAFDRQGRYSKIYRKAFGCSRSKAADPATFVDPTVNNVAPAPLPTLNLNLWNPMENLEIATPTKWEKPTRIETPAKVSESFDEYAEKIRLEAEKREAQATIQGRQNAKGRFDDCEVVEVR